MRHLFLPRRRKGHILLDFERRGVIDRLHPGAVVAPCLRRRKARKDDRKDKANDKNQQHPGTCAMLPLHRFSLRLGAFRSLR